MALFCQQIPCLGRLVCAPLAEVQGLHEHASASAQPITVGLADARGDAWPLVPPQRQRCMSNTFR
eukprot:9490507-Lingulodinium_polyedra.AAC.1